MQIFATPDNSLISLYQHPRLRPRPNILWREREARRKYRLPPGWEKLPLNKDHFISIAEDRTQLSWFPDDNCRLFDRRRLINPADYLKRFHPDLSEDERKKCLRYLEPSSIRIAETGADAVKVYETQDLYRTRNHDSESCMTGDYTADRYRAPGNLRVAYLPNLEQPEDLAQVRSRCIVNIETMYYGDIYAPHGDAEIRDEMILGLTQLGYRPGLNDRPMEENKFPGRRPNNYDMRATVILDTTNED